MPQTENYICIKCNFKGSSFSTWGSYSYHINDELIPINTNIAICYSCQSIVPAEILPMEEPSQPLQNVNNFIKHVFYEEEVARFEALKDRKSSARCLACGSHDFELIPYVEPDNDHRITGLPIRTGLFHRNCGGRIYAEFRSPNFFMGDTLPERFYDFEGVEIEKS